MMSMWPPPNPSSALIKLFKGEDPGVEEPEGGAMASTPLHEHQAETDEAEEMNDENREYDAEWLRRTLKGHAGDLRSRQRKCREGKGSAHGRPPEVIKALADAYGEAAAVFERRLAEVDPPPSPAP